MDKHKYIPMNNLVKDKKTEWTFTHLNMEYIEIAKHGIVMWCIENLEGRWTMLGGNKFAFEDGEDATLFKIQFGFGVS
jgi:hypothetical protein